MSNDAANFSELRGLLDQLCRGEASAAEVQRIQQLAGDSRESRSYFIEYMQLHGALAWHYRDTPLRAAALGLSGPAPLLGFLGDSARATWTSFGLPLKFLIVGLAVGFWVFWAYVIHAERRQLANRAERAAGVARVEQTGADCRFAPNAALRPGESLAVGDVVKIESGQLAFTLASGAHGILDGPATFELSSANGGFLRHGKLTARVPRSAIGFAVETPSAIVIDLGTEFGVEVQAGGATDVQVFEGAVDFVPRPRDAERPQPALTRRRLEAGQAARIAGPAQSVEPGYFGPNKFARQIAKAKRTQREVPIDLRGAVATQSSLYPDRDAGYVPEAAIDGDPKTYSVTSDEPGSSAWWKVDLGRVRPVSSVVIHNDESQRGWLRDITVRLLADDGQTVVAHSPLINRGNHLGGGEEDFDRGPSQLSFTFSRQAGEAPAGRYVVIAREPCTLDRSRMKTQRGEGFLNGCRASLALGEVEVYELDADTVRPMDVPEP